MTSLVSRTLPRPVTLQLSGPLHCHDWLFSSCCPALPSFCSRVLPSASAPSLSFPGATCLVLLPCSCSVPCSAPGPQLFPPALPRTLISAPFLPPRLSSPLQPPTFLTTFLLDFSDPCLRRPPPMLFLCFSGPVRLHLPALSSSSAILLPLPLAFPFCFALFFFGSFMSSAFCFSLFPLAFSLVFLSPPLFPLPLFCSFLRAAAAVPVTCSASCSPSSPTCSPPLLLFSSTSTRPSASKPAVQQAGAQVKGLVSLFYPFIKAKGAWKWGSGLSLV